MYIIKNDECRVSVRNVIEFILRSGDLDNTQISETIQTEAMLLGSKLHRKIQKSMPSDYKAEVSLKTRFEYEDYSIVIEGRADGIIENSELVIIDEIKTMFCNMEYVLEPVFLHKAQAMCYAYMYLKDHPSDKIGIQMTYCDIDTEEIKRFNYVYDRDYIVQWFENVISSFNKWISFMRNNERERNKTIRALEFPFEYREGQRSLVVDVYRSIVRSKRLFIEAPTGVGKTISTIFPSIKAMGEEKLDRIFYLTAKTITRTVAFDTFALLKDKGLHFRSIIITAKDKCCILSKPECNPKACEYAKGHYDRINEAIYDIITHELLIDRETLLKYANKHRVCPFEFSLDVSEWCDGIICDYNYAFDPNATLKRYFQEDNVKDYVLLVDEAHNLIDRARSMYSGELYKEAFLEAKRALDKRSIRLDKALNRCNTAFLKLKKENISGNRINLEPGFFNALSRCHDELSKFLEENKRFEKREPLLELFFDIRHFLKMCECFEEDYITYVDDTKDGFLVKHYLVNTANRLGERTNKCRSVILFSATLLPINYYKDMLGNSEDYAIYANSIFDPEKRKLMISRDVTSRYTRRTQAEFNKIAHYIDGVANVKCGNYMVFFPSYKYMQEVFYVFNDLYEDKYECVVQEGNMTETKKEEFLERFSKNNGKTLIGFSVIGGIFSEGIDLREDALIGVIVVGTGLPQICNERELLREKLNEAGYNGFNYAYVYPGMNKVLQAAGRLIRTENDTGVLALLDERFLERQYTSLFPREWSTYDVVNAYDVGKYCEEFWNKNT